MADDEQFSLCWNNFNSNLSAGFHESLCRGDLVDVTLAAEGQFVKAHRLVLSVCSPYFRKMFTQMPANQHAFVFLKDVSHTALKDLIQFMYCGEVNVKQEALPAFISTAEALQIKGLTDSDPPPSQSPTEPSTPTPQIQPISSPRVRQRTSTSRSFKIESVDDSGDDNKQTQIVIQTTSAPPPTQQQVIAQPQTQHLQQQTQQNQTHIAPQQIASTTTATTTTVVTHKRPAARSIGGVPHIKRTKSTIDPLDTTDTSTTGPQQITVQTAVVAASTSDTKTQVHQQQQQHHHQQSEPEYIDLPIELPTKSEPDYADDAGDVEGGENEATYVEDDSYGELRYDESYFTENDEGGAATTVQQSGAGTGGSSASATTSKALVKQQQSFTDTSYVDVADQANSDAQATEILSRKRYKVHSDEDRSRVVEAANSNDDWISMAASLGVNYKTAYHWVTSGRDKMLKRGGVKAKSLTVEEIDEIINWIEDNCTLTLKQIQMKLYHTFQKQVSTSTIGNNLQGRLYNIKNVHQLPASINSAVSKEKRAGYVRAITTCIQAGKQIIYIDEINFNLFCRRARGTRPGGGEIHMPPAARGLSIHVIGAVATSGIIAMDRQRGCFKAVDACNWLQTVLQRWVAMGYSLRNLVIACDNFPCNSYLENAINNLNTEEKPTILRLAPNSPMLNPIEKIWSKMKTYVKAKLVIPDTFDHGVVEQRLSFVECLIDEAKTQIIEADCAQAIYDTTFFHSDALSLVDMPMGNQN